MAKETKAFQWSSIRWINESHEYTAGDGERRHCGQYNSLRERCNSLCQRCAHLKRGPITIGKGIKISAESSYCDSDISLMQIVGSAVAKCSEFKETNKEER